MAAGVVPAVVFLIAAAVMGADPLTERVYRPIVGDLAERRASADVERAGAG